VHDRPNLYLLRAAEAEKHAQSFSHPWNPRSEIIGTQLGRMVGLRRTGVSRVRVPPGKESFVYHSHQTEEEWIYILSGRGTARIDGVQYDVAAGDFMGFPTPSVAHHLANTSSEDLVYLMGGEHHEVEIADFPDLGRRMVRRGNAIEVYEADAARPFSVPPGE
jgi:uncharacterized cupin superfamily protein